MSKFLRKTDFLTWYFCTFLVCLWILLHGLLLEYKGNFFFFFFTKLFQNNLMNLLFVPDKNPFFGRTLVVTLSLFISSILLKQYFLIVLFSLFFDPAFNIPPSKQKDSDRDFILTFMGDHTSKKSAGTWTYLYWPDQQTGNSSPEGLSPSAD